MASNFLFSCCNNTSLEESSQTTCNSVPRNIISKNKTCLSLNSPKASLKNVGLLRSPKNNKTLNSSANLNMVSTVDIAHLQKSNNVNNFQPVLDVSFKPSRFNIATKVENHPMPPYIWPPVIKTPKQNIHFTYKNPTNPQHIIPLFRMPEKDKKIEKKQITNEVREEESKTKQEKPKENIIKFIQKQQRSDAVIEEKKQLAVPINKKKYNLGGSKYTILSQGEMESSLEQNSFNMEQSAVVFNVFNLTKSQIHKWEQAKLKKSANKTSITFNPSQQNQAMNSQNTEK